jgi:hypothetical protein
VIRADHLPPGDWRVPWDKTAKEDLRTTALMGSDASGGPYWAAPVASPTRVWSVIQFTSQVLPPSSEKDCSKCGESTWFPTTQIAQRCFCR